MVRYVFRCGFNVVWRAWLGGLSASLPHRATVPPARAPEYHTRSP